MATNHTTNYALNLWEPQDAFLREEFNENTQKLDAALASHDAALATKGNCRIVYGSYVGNGKSGEYNPNTLTFPGKPLLVIINQGGFFCAVAGSESVFGYSKYGSVICPVLTWGENSLTWYSNSDADRQLNTTGLRYYYIALIATD